MKRFLYGLLVGYPSPEAMLFLGRLRDRLQPQFENRLKVVFDGGPNDSFATSALPDLHHLVEEHVVGKRLWVFTKREVRILVTIPFGFFDHIEVKDKSIKGIVEEELAKFQTEPNWVPA